MLSTLAAWGTTGSSHHRKRLPRAMAPAWAGGGGCGKPEVLKRGISGYVPDTWPATGPCRYRLVSRPPVRRIGVICRFARATSGVVYPGSRCGFVGSRRVTQAVDRAGWATLGTWTSSAAAFPKARCAVEMATGTGKTRTAVAFVKRLFEAGVVTRVLFLVDRIALAAARLPSTHAVAPRRFLSRLVRHDWLRRCRPLRDL